MNSSETYRKEVRKLAEKSRYVSNEERRAAREKIKNSILFFIVFVIVTAAGIFLLIPANMFKILSKEEITILFLLIATLSHTITKIIMTIYFEITGKNSSSQAASSQASLPQANVYPDEGNNCNDLNDEFSMAIAGIEPYASIYGFKNYKLDD